MIAQSQQVTLQEMTDAYASRGVSALHGFLECPVLVECSGMPPVAAPSFATATATWDVRVVLALARTGTLADPALVARAGLIFPVVKRAGGPFPDRIGVGRARTADICLRHTSVSKYHAYFTQDDTGRWHVWDARSRNGTRIRDVLLEPGQGAELSCGTLLVLGGDVCVFFSPLGFRGFLDAMRR